MKLKRKFPSSFTNLVKGTIFALSITIGIVLLILIYLFVFPLQPKAYGNFPHQIGWVFSASEKIVSTPAIYDNLVILRTPNSIIAIDGKNGRNIWNVESNIPIGINVDDLTLSPLISDSTLIVPEYGASVSAYRIEDGNKIWRIPEIEVNLHSPKIASIENYSIGGDKLYIARWSWNLSAHDLKSGALLWETKVPNKSTLLVISNDYNLFLSTDQTLQSLDQQTGKVIWQRQFGSFIQQMLIDNNVLYIALSGQQESLVAIDLNTSQVIWSVNREELGNEGLKTIALEGDRLYGGGNKLFAFSIDDGSLIWSSDETDLLESPIVFDSFVYARNRDKKLFQFDATTGEVTGNLIVKLNSPMKYDPERSPVVFENLLIVPFGDDRVFAYLLK